MGVDREAALRMIHLSGQQGVPVIAIDDEVVIGFDRRRLEELLSRPGGAKVELGAAVADAMPHVKMEGAYVGRIKRGSLAQRAGLQARDVIVDIDGKAVRNAADLERIIAGLRPGMRASLVYVRQGKRIQTELPI